jgi:hypothetical protein
MADRQRHSSLHRRHGLLPRRHVSKRLLLRTRGPRLWHEPNLLRLPALRTSAERSHHCLPALNGFNRRTLARALLTSDAATPSVRGEGGNRVSLYDVDKFVNQSSTSTVGKRNRRRSAAFTLLKLLPGPRDDGLDMDFTGCEIGAASEAELEAEVVV